MAFLFRGLASTPGLFETCSAFTRAMARMPAKSPVATLCTGGFGCYRLERRLPGGMCPAEVLRPFTAHE